MIEKELPELQNEKSALEENMNSGLMDFESLQKAADRMTDINRID
jgi:hypothetical protein